MQQNIRAAAALIVLLGIAGAGWAGTGTQALLGTLKSVEGEGKGNVQAAQALRELSQQNASVLPQVLEAFRGAGPLAANWLRSAVESIADAEIKRGGTLPLDKLEAFLRDRGQVPRARRLAFELIQRTDRARAERLVPGLIDDPSPELRREAVARLIAEAGKLLKAGDNEQAAAFYDGALAGAVDDDQVKAIVGPLKKLGRNVDLPRHFGFVTEWSIIGPFNNRERVGFDTVYPPEKEIDLKASYDGQLGKVTWRPISTDHDYGIVDIAEELENYKGSTMYAAADFYSDRRRTVEIRLGTPNAWKLWVNGQLKFAREEYHRGMKLDQYRVAPVELKPGRYTILLKICQNEQDDSWAQRYQFQLRVCSATGEAVPSRENLQSRSAPRNRNSALTGR